MRERNRPPSTKTPLVPQPFLPPGAPAWARASGRAGLGDPLFAAGAGLALLDSFLRHDPPAAEALRSRLALQSAAAAAKILRLNAGAAALRDLRSAISDDSGPSARLRLWRTVAQPTGPASTRAGSSTSRRRGSTSLCRPKANFDRFLRGKRGRVNSPRSSPLKAVSEARSRRLQDSDRGAARRPHHQSGARRASRLVADALLEPSAPARGGGRNLGLPRARIAAPLSGAQSRSLSSRSSSPDTKSTISTASSGP